MKLSTSAVSVFLATTDAETCKVFYGGKLGLSLVSEDDFAVVYALSGAELRISKVPKFTPQPFTVLDWQTDDIDAAHASLTDAGIEPVIYEGMGQDEKGIWTVPGAPVRILWFRDPDGNLLSVSQRA